VLVELGRVEDALDRLSRLDAAAEERGETHELIEYVCCRFRCRGAGDGRS
jgi:hypothetical protein